MTSDKTPRCAPLMAGLLAAGMFLSGQAQAHFGMLIPSDDMIKQGESRHLKLDVMFWHPFEGHGMNLARPERFGALINGERQVDLLGKLKPVKRTDVNGKKRDGFILKYGIKKPGDYTFYMQPKPYWEPAEESFIVHYTKVVVNAFGLEEGWDKPVGLKTEIVPLSRPYGLYTGNVMRGRVLVDGRPVPNTTVEVEYFNEDHSLKAEADPLITQVVKTDDNGVFTYAMPRAGWWGFAALNEGENRVHEGKEYPTEIGAVLWVKTHDMK